MALLRGRPADQDAFADWASLEWPVRLYLADDAARAREPLAPTPVPREAASTRGARAFRAIAVRGARSFVTFERAPPRALSAARSRRRPQVVELSDAFVALGAPVSVASSSVYDDEDAWGWGALYDPRSETPGCYSHYVTYLTDDCSGPVHRVDDFFTYYGDVCVQNCDDFIGLLSYVCESFVDDCCKRM